MRKTLRLGLAAGSGLVALAFTSVAVAAYAPQFSVTRNVNVATGDVVTDLTYTQTQADDPVARVTFYVPTGYSASLGQAAGAQIGTLEGSVFAAEISSVVPVNGAIVVADKTSPQAQAAATQCTGSANHTAIWILNVSAAGSTLAVPAYIDSPTGLPFASAAVTFCLAHPSTVVFKIRLLNATLHLPNIFAPPAAAGTYRWTGINTPWEPDTATLNAAATIETQALDSTPVDASLIGKRQTKTRTVKKKAYTDIFYTYFAKLSGSANVAGGNAASVNVDIFSGDTKITSATTGSDGSWSTTLKLTKTTSYRAVYTRPAAALVGATCDPRIPFPGTAVLIPCGTITNGGFVATTGEVKVVKPKLMHKRIKHKKPKKKPKH